MKCRDFAVERILLYAMMCLFIMAGFSLAQEHASETGEIEALKGRLAGNPHDAQAHCDLGILLDRAQQREEALAHLEEAIKLKPEEITYANLYRMRIREYGHEYYDRSIRFFEALVEDHPKTVELRLNKSLSYIDKMPYPRLGIVHQGILSNRSIAELNTVLELDPNCWAALYARATNHLHWPRMLKHAPRAIEDFKKLVAMQESWGPEKQEPYFVLPYVALGDAYVKNRATDSAGMFAKARETWKAGRAIYPNDPELKKRLSMSDKELAALIKKVCGLEDPIDTDLSIMWVSW